MNLEALFFSSLLQSGSIGDLRGVPRDWFNDGWANVYDFVWNFARERRVLPRAETVAYSFGIALPPAPEDIGFYIKQLRDNAMRVVIEKGFEDRVVKPLGDAQPSVALDGAKAVVAEVSRTFRDIDRGLVLDVESNVDARMADYHRRKRARDGVGLPLPWPTMTSATGGFMTSEAWAVLARPNIGKTFALIVMATYLWQLGYNVLFASMETPPQGTRAPDRRHRVVRGVCIRCFEPGVSPDQECAAPPRQQLSVRFDSIGSRLSAWRMLKGCLTPQEEMRLQQFYEYCRNPTAYGWGRFRMVSAPAIATVTDLETEIMGFDPDIVFWDSAYLAAREGSRRTEKAAELVVDFKLMLERAAIPGCVSWHFNRDVDEKATHASQNNAALTDELGRIFDVLIGLFRPPEFVDAGEALWRSLKVRDGVQMPELKTYFNVKELVNFAEISGTAS